MYQSNLGSDSAWLDAFTAKVFSPDIKRNRISTESMYICIHLLWDQVWICKSLIFTTFFSFISLVEPKKKMSKWHKPKPRKFLLEVSGVPNSAFSQWQDLSNNVILLPLASPNLAKIPFQTDVNQHAFLSRNIWKIKQLFVHIKEEGICYLPWVSVGYMSCQT